MEREEIDREGRENDGGSKGGDYDDCKDQSTSERWCGAAHPRVLRTAMG